MQWIQGLQVLVERWFSLFINTWFEERPKYWSCKKKKCTAVSTCNLWIESDPNTGVVHVQTGQGQSELNSSYIVYPVSNYVFVGSFKYIMELIVKKKTYWVNKLLEPENYQDWQSGD